MGKTLQLLAVGRLCAQKSYEVLIEVFAALAPRHPAWELVIVGNGEAQGRIAANIARHGLEDAGTTDAPRHGRYVPTYTGARPCFCMPSQWEGFPNALAEAMAHGLPAVGYRGCAGVRDLIVHGENGLLAEGNGNVQSLFETLDRLMADPIRRRRMEDAAMKSVQQYHPDLIFSRWEQLLRSVETSR